MNISKKYLAAQLFELIIPFLNEFAKPFDRLLSYSSRSAYIRRIPIFSS